MSASFRRVKKKKKGKFNLHQPCSTSKSHFPMHNNIHNSMFLFIWIWKSLKVRYSISAVATFLFSFSFPPFHLSFWPSHKILCPMKQKYHQNSLQKRDGIVLVLQFSPRDFSLLAPSPGKHCPTFWDPLFQFNLTNLRITVFNFHITWLNCQHNCPAGVQLSFLKNLCKL